jgi:sortase A
MRWWLGTLLLGTGTLLLLAGGGVWLLSETGQEEALREWRSREAEWETAAATADYVADGPVAAQDGDVVARLWVPQLGREEFILRGATRRNLLKGAAWLSDSAPPGSRGNCIIAGHRDTHFRFLKDLRAGDEVVVQPDWERRYRYRVTGLEIVRPTHTAYLGATREAALTLITCYPFYYVGKAPMRYIVRADIVATENIDP